MYHDCVHSLADRVLVDIRRNELLLAGDRIGVAVSGGIDSVALLRLLLELGQGIGIVISVVHFNHKLRGAESEADQEFVAALAREHGLEFHCSSGDVARLAAEEHSGIEAAARELRYEFFHRLLAVGGEFTSAAEAGIRGGFNRSAGSAAAPKSFPQGLKPKSSGELNGTAEAVPFPAVPFAVLAAPEVGRLHHTPDEIALDKIATGHTLDDQAETVLMRLIRGTGLRGLGGIYPRIAVEGDDDGDRCGEIIRPLLGIRRRELEQYLVDLKQPWREDSTNAESKFTRNRVRKIVLPLLEREFNPSIVENLAELAEIARDEEDYWENEISGWLGTVVQWADAGAQSVDDGQRLVQIRLNSASSVPAGAQQAEAAVETPRGAGGGANVPEVPRSARDDTLGQIVNAEENDARSDVSLSRPWLLTESVAVQRRVVKAVGEQAGIPLEFKHVEEILRFAGDDGPSGKELSLPLGWKIVRESEAMVFVAPDLSGQQPARDYEYVLTIPGRIVLAELGGVIEALRIGRGEGIAEYNPQQLLRADLLPAQLTVRNWRPGDRFWPAHTKSAKKIKELLQGRHLGQAERRLWPVALSGDEIVWMRGFPVPATLQARVGQEAVLIREMPWNADDYAI